jgi:hypothetical protein
MSYAVNTEARNLLTTLKQNYKDRRATTRRLRWPGPRNTRSERVRQRCLDAKHRQHSFIFFSPRLANRNVSNTTFPPLHLIKRSKPKQSLYVNSTRARVPTTLYHMCVEESRLASYAKHAANISQTRDLFGNHRVYSTFRIL